MKFIIEINNKTKYKHPKKFFLETFRHTMELADVACIADRTIELSVALIDDDEMQTLNNQYRKKNSPTDVLSFCEHESIKELCRKNDLEKEQPVFIGELILCPTYINKNADEDGESMEYALSCIMAHGILHLLGYPHGKKMFVLQKRVAVDLIKR